MAAIPTIAEEDSRRPNREHEKLVGEQTRAINRIKSTLIRFGIRAFRIKLRQASKHLEELRGPEGEPLLQCFGSPRSQPRIARINNPASSRSVFARRCSRDTGMLVGWIT